MRILGAILVVVGLLICLTIIGIPIGLILIFVGTLLIVFGSRRRTVITNVVQVSTTPGQQSVRMEDDTGRMVSPPRHSAMIDVTPSKSGVSLNNLTAEDYDRAKWHALLKYDGDIARVAERLNVLGQHRVDEFAKAYLAINDKSYLPIILEKIIAQARKEI